MRLQHKLSESASTLLQSFTFTDLPSSMVRLAERLLLMSIVVGLPTFEINHSDQYVYKPFWMNSRKPVFPPQLKQQETVFKVISNFREYIDWLENNLFALQFVQVKTSISFKMLKIVVGHQFPSCFCNKHCENIILRSRW